MLISFRGSREQFRHKGDRIFSEILSIGTNVVGRRPGRSTAMINGYVGVYAALAVSTVYKELSGGGREAYINHCQSISLFLSAGEQTQGFTTLSAFWTQVYIPGSQ